MNICSILQPMPKKIVLTGSSGFLGQHLFSSLKRVYPKSIISTPSSKDADLRILENCLKITTKADLVIHAAANVGGIGKNQQLPGTLLYDNAIMGLYMIEAAKLNKVSKTIVIGTVCEYPKYTDIPFKESDIWLGYPESTNAPYGLAKKLLLVQGQAYHQEFGINIIHILPTNLYGPHDHIDAQYAHVIPDLIRKFHTAKNTKQPTVTLWGDGSATREFMYVADAADAIVLISKKYDSQDPINIGSGEEISIKDLAELIKNKIGYTGEIIWDTSRPNGQPRRLIDHSKLASLKFKPKTNISTGLDKTINWYIKSIQT